MRIAALTFILVSLLIWGPQLFSQKQCGVLSTDPIYNQELESSIYHQYQLHLKKGGINLLDVSDYDVAIEFTVVSPAGVVIEQINNADTGDFLIFESPVDGTYQFYLHIIDDEAPATNYSIQAEFIAPNKDRLAQIKELLHHLERPDRAGTAISIIEKGQTIYEHYHGYANAEHQVKNNAETVFELASVSKQFTAMAIAKLAEEKKLSIEDDIRLYFPELPVYETPIKVKHLLNHTSGLIDSHYPLVLAGFENDQIDLHRVLSFLRNTPEQYFESGSAFSYSNDGYTLLGELVNRVTKQSFRDWTEEHLFAPLNMNSTMIRDSPKTVIPNRAMSYKSNMRADAFHRVSFDFYAPGGCSVRSSMNDLIKWVNYLDQGYQSDASLFQRINQVDELPNGDSSEYAYGNFITDFRGLKRISHLGLSAGFTTSVARFPEEELSFIFLGNDGDFRNYYLSRKIYEIFLSDRINPLTTMFEGIETVTLETTAPSVEPGVSLTDYEGSYFAQQIHTSYTFEAIEDTLFALSAAYEPVPLIPLGVDTFETDEDYMETIIFKRDYNQAVSDCHIYNDSEDHKITFRKFSTEKRWPKDHRWYTDEHQQFIQDTLEQLEASKTFPGFAISVFDESETLYQRGFGYANTEVKKGYDPKSVQQIASITKTITGMAIMKAMELGHISLDDAINDYLPYDIVNPQFPDDEMTIRQLLTHTSSLDDPKNDSHGYVFSEPLDKDNWPEPHHEGLARYSNNKHMSLGEFLKSICSPDGIWYDEAEMYTKHRPGTNFEYSNLGFALLGHILELATGEDFRDFTQEHIFDPLGMHSASWELDRADPHHVTYYIENYNVCPDYTINTIPDGGLHINIIDLTKFLQEAIKGYAGRGKLLTQSSYDEMFRSQSELFEIEGGLGWDLSISCCVGHGGNDFGVATVMYFEPRTGLGRIIFTNISIESDEVDDLFYGIMNLLFY